MEFDNLADLRVLLATAETGSLTAAGRRCGLSTAAVSAAMKRLEKTLGARLFERTTRSVRPTPEGDVMIEHARRALELVAEGHARVRAGCGDLSGTIRITASTAMSHQVLAPWLARFAERHPGVAIDLQVSDAHLDFVRDGVDIALRNGPLPDSNLVARLLAPAHRVACASPAYLAAHGTPSHPAELQRHECITYHVRGRLLNAWSFVPHDGGPAAAPCEVRVRGRLACDTAAIAQLWARQGGGIVYQSALDLGDALRNGELVRLFPGWLGAPVPLYAVLPSQRYVPARVRVLIEALAEWFADGGAPAQAGTASCSSAATASGGKGLLTR
jgi:DNA-binding transcriptional LysR family regulator